IEALEDDLNTPQAIAALHRASPEELAGGLALLGFSGDPERIAAKASVDESEIAAAIEKRNAARKAKDFKESDRVHDELLPKGRVRRCANAFSSSTPRSATGRRRRASISRSRTSARSRWRSMRWAWITSKAAGPAPTRPTRRSFPNGRR